MRSFRLKTNGGEIVRGESAMDVVRAMHETAAMAPRDVKAYMREVAERAKLQSGVTVPVDNPEAFSPDCSPPG